MLLIIKFKYFAIDFIIYSIKLTFKQPCFIIVSNFSHILILVKHYYIA